MPMPPKDYAAKNFANQQQAKGSGKVGTAFDTFTNIDTPIAYNQIEQQQQVIDKLQEEVAERDREILQLYRTLHRIRGEW